MMGRKRKADKSLPRRVYKRSGSFWFVHPTGKWIKLGRTEREMYNALANLSETRAGTLKVHFQRYRKDTQNGLASKAPKTQKGQGHQLDLLTKVFGEMLPQEVTSRHVAQFLRGHSAPKQANRTIALLSHVYTTMISWWLVDGVTSNPCAHVQRMTRGSSMHETCHQLIGIDKTKRLPRPLAQSKLLPKEACLLLLGQRSRGFLQLYTLFSGRCAGSTPPQWMIIRDFISSCHACRHSPPFQRHNHRIVRCRWMKRQANMAVVCK